MSKEIDERVVEMRFDNEHFEKNVQTSMSTLDKFKQKLRFKDASKGFDDIDKAAKKTDLSPLAKSADKVGIRFNAMYTVADQAFRNITNSAMAAGKRIISALTIDPVKTGLSEYETKINAVQVIKANTRGKFATEDEQMDAIYKALGELNDYADRTIYNYAQMTDNVGKFVAQTGDVEKSVKAVQGLANLAGASGASAADMARATYQMSQALSGTIRKIDWNSLRNANMAGQELKNMLIDLAKVEGVDIDSLITKKGTFEDTLEEGWLTGDLFMKAMNIYSDAYSEAELAAMGFTETQIANFKDIAKTANEATTEVKTFTQLFDVLKETAQSGWTQTWEIIFGDFGTAKKMFTELQIYFSGILNDFAEARNILLEGAFNLKNPWTKIWEKLETAGLAKFVSRFDKISDAIEGATGDLEYFQKVVNDVWMGKYKNSDTGRFELLEAAGYNHKVVQDLVNKGIDYNLTMEDIEASHKKFGLTVNSNSESLKSAGKNAEEMATKLEEITDEQLKQAGLTKHEIKLYRELAEEAKRAGVPMMELAREMSENDGRTMLIESLKNAWSGLATILTAVKDAWVDVFPPMTVVQLYNIIKGIREFSENLIVHEKTAKNLTRTFKGLFAILDIIFTLVSLPMKIAFKAITQLLEVLDIDILSVTAVIGDAIVGFRDFIDASLDFTAIFEKIAPAIRKGIKVLSEWFGTIKDGFQNGFDDIPNNIVTGFIQGIWGGLKSAGDAIAKFGQTIIDKICEVLGIHSPSTVFFAIGGFIIAGLLLGIKTFAPEVWETIKGVGSKCIDVIKEIDFGAVISALVSAGMTIALLKIANAFENFTDVFDGVGDMLDDFGKGVKKFLGGIGAKFRGEAIKDIAVAILILVGAIFILTKLNPTAVVGAVTVIGILIGMLHLLSKSSGKFDVTQATSLTKVVGMLIGISIAVLILASAMNKLASLNIEDNWPSIFGGLAATIVSLGLVMVAYGKFVKGKAAVNIDKAGITILKIAGTMLLMAFVMKIIGGIDGGALIKGGVVISAFTAIVVGLIAASNLAGPKINSAAALVGNVGKTLLLMAIACKIIATMSWVELGKAAIGITVFGIIVAGLIAVTKKASGRDVSRAGTLIASVSGAMLMMAITGKILATMSLGDMAKGLIGIAVLSGIVVGLVAATKLASNKDLKKAGFMVLTLSIAIGILGLIAMLMSIMDVSALAKGVGAVTVLGLIMTAMIAATSKAKKCIGNLVVMTTAIAIMATSIAVLSMIDTPKLFASAASMALVMGMFATMMIATSKIKTGKTTIKNLLIVSGMVVLLAGIVAGLSFIDGGNALASIAALSILIVALTGVLMIISKSPVDMKTVLPGLYGLGIMMVALIAFAVIVNYLPMNNIGDKQEALAALTLVIAAMSTILIVTAAAGAIYKATGAMAMLGLAGMVAMLGMFIGFAAAINAIPMDTIADKAEALGVLTLVMAAMSVLLVITAAAGAIYAVTGGMAMLGLVGMLAMLAMFVGFAAVINAIPMDTIASKTEALDVLIDLITVLSDILVKLAIVGPLAVIGVAALAGLSGLIVALGAFAVGIGALMAKFPSLKTFLDTGIPVLEQLAYAIGSMISKFVSGLFSGLPDIGKALSSFMKEAEVFFTGIKMVNGDTLKSVLALVGIFAALTATELVSSVTSFIKEKIFGESQFENFGKGMVGLAKCIKDFTDVTDSLTDDEVKKVKHAAEILKAMAGAAKEIPNSGGLACLLYGNNDIDDFIAMVIGDPANGKKGIKDLAECMSDIKITEDTTKSVGRVIDVIVALTKASKDIPNSGGLAGLLSGNNDIDDFIAMVIGDPANGKKGIKDLAECMSDVTTIADDTIKGVECATNVITTLAKASKDIPNTGGMGILFNGDNSISDFMEMIMGNPDYDKKGMKELAEYLSDITLTNHTVNSVACAANVIATLAKASKDIPNTGGMGILFNGDNSISDFINMLIGDDSKNGIKELVTHLSDIDIDNATTNKIKDVVSVVEAVITAASTLKDKTAKNFKNFSKKLVEFVKEFKTFVEKMNAIGDAKITSAKNSLQELVTLCGEFSSSDVDNISNFGKALSDVAVGGIAKFVAAFTSEISISTVKDAIDAFVSTAAGQAMSKDNQKKFAIIGVYLMAGLRTGIENGQSEVVNAAVAVVEAAEKAANDAAQIKSPSKKFATIGKYVVEGFAKGITDNSYRTEDAMGDLTDDLLDHTQDELKIHSPSVVYEEEVGRYIVQGIAEGITKEMSAEDAMTQKLTNIYNAWEDWNAKHPGSPIDIEDLIRSSSSKLTFTSKDFATAKELGYDSIWDWAADEALRRGAESTDKFEEQADAVADMYADSIKDLESKIKTNESDYKWDSALTFDSNTKERMKKTYLEEQIGYTKQLIDTYNEEIASYRQRTGVGDDFEDAFISDIIAKIREKTLELEEYQDSLTTIEADIASEEAKKISEKYKETTDRINSDLEMLDSRYEEFAYTHPDATNYAKESRLNDYLNGQLNLLREQEENSRKMFNEIAVLSKSDSEEYREAYQRWVNDRLARFKKEEEITNLEEQRLKELDEAEDRVRESEYAVWVARNENATEAEKHAREETYLNSKLEDIESEASEIYDKYLKVLEKEGGKQTTEALNLLADWNEKTEEALSLRNQINDNRKAYTDSVEKANEESSDKLRTSNYELWELEHQDASEAEKRNMKLAYLVESKIDAMEDVVKAQEEYEKLLKDETATEADIAYALVELNEAKKTVAELQNQINETEEETVSLIEEQRDLAYNAAKIEYDIWEKTVGRDADDAEKEAKQLEYLNKQLAIQNGITKEVLNEYNEAIANYGSGSIEASRAYKAYLDELYNAAELKNQILDLEESAADRQKRLRDKQDLAQKDYDDYIKKYKKYYLANGMSLEDLKRDAKLVTGYDPAKVVNNITNKTKTALEAVTTSVNYQSILTGFTDMGNSYIEALNEGITDESIVIKDTTSKMIEECMSKMKKTRPKWIQTGRYLISGFIEGIKSREVDAINAIVGMAVRALKAAKEALGVESPSKEFAEIGRYSVLGLVKGLVDNSGLSDDAAAHIGDSAIESLKNSIRQISDVVNSDLDTQPTIRPVLDLSNIRSGTARLNAMVSNAQAIAISDSRKTRENYDENQNGNDSSTNSGNTYQFTQNNYSPKALSRTEIYRQTKNQFTAMKEVLT